MKSDADADQDRLCATCIAYRLNIYTHAVDASHRKPVEELEERLFGEMDCSGLKSSTTAD
jgi:hypothetical protein